MFKRILVPLDGSPLAEAVLPHAQHVAGLHGAELRLLRVIVFPTAGTSLADAELAARYREDLAELRAEAHAYVERLALSLRAGGTAASAETREGDVCEAILRAADERACDLIAMSTHGRSRSARWLLGSVADRVVRMARVPVLLIRPQITLMDVRRRRREMQAVLSESRWI